MVEYVYRAMIADPEDARRPLIGETHLTLGPRVPWDVVPDSSNYVSPTGPDGKPQGIAVWSTLSDVKVGNGSGAIEAAETNPVWQIDVKVLAANQLAAMPRNGPSNGEESDLILATLARVSWPEYWYDLAKTQKLWVKVGVTTKEEREAEPRKEPPRTVGLRAGGKKVSKTKRRTAGDNDCFKSPVDDQADGRIADLWSPQRKQGAEPKPRREPTNEAVMVSLEGVLAERCDMPNAAPATARVEQLSTMPYAATGKLFFDWNGKPWVGSAWIIDTTPQGIVTAAHNVLDEDDAGKMTWSTNLVFDLQYDDGGMAASWEIEQAIVLKQWNEGMDDAYDFAVLVPKAEVKDQPALAVLLDQTAESYRGLGYPSRPIPGYRFIGKVMWESTGGFIDETDGVVSAENNLTKGSSGGPWCARLHESWVVNGVQSGGPIGNPDISFSSYLTEATFGALLACSDLEI